MTDSHERWPRVNRPHIVRCRAHVGSQTRFEYWPALRVPPPEQRRFLLIRGGDDGGEGPTPDGGRPSNVGMPAHLALVAPATLGLRDPLASRVPSTLGSDRGLPVGDVAMSQTWSRRHLAALCRFLVHMIEGGALSDPTLFRAPGDVS